MSNTAPSTLTTSVCARNDLINILSAKDGRFSFGIAAHPFSFQNLKNFKNLDELLVIPNNFFNFASSNNYKQFRKVEATPKQFSQQKIKY